jgi:hypothetical protein
MKANPNRLWYVTIALGWAFDFLFWKKTPGVNFALFATLCLFGGLYLLLSDGLRPNKWTWLLLPLFVFFAVIIFVRAETMTMLLAYSFTLFLMSIMAISYLGGKWFKYNLVDYINRFVHLMASMIARPIAYSTKAHQMQVEAGIIPRRRNIWPIVRGIVIALPILAIFASLLASADVVFSQRLRDLIEAFHLERLPEYIFRLIYILAIGYALAGVILHAASESRDEKLAGVEKPILPAFLGFIESTIVLGSVIILFGAFVVVQFKYFFGGQSNIHIEGFTYAEYARRGFGELVVVAFFSLLLLLGLSAITKRDTTSQRKTFSTLGAALVALVLVMLVSAYQRLGLYESAYGFSRLRTYTHVILVWIGLLLVATIVLEFLRKERTLTLAALIASLGFAISLALLNVDAFIVRQNIARELHGNKAEAVVELDARYFLVLSDDAIPELVDAYGTSSLPAPVKDKLGAALACIRLSRSRDGRVYPWQSFQFARQNADRELASIKEQLDQFKVETNPARVIMPNGAEFSC